MNATEVLLDTRARAAATASAKCQGRWRSLCFQAPGCHRGIVWLQACPVLSLLSLLSSSIHISHKHSSTCISIQRLTSSLFSFLILRYPTLPYPLPCKVSYVSSSPFPPPKTPNKTNKPLSNPTSCFPLLCKRKNNNQGPSTFEYTLNPRKHDTPPSIRITTLPQPPYSRLN